MTHASPRSRAPARAHLPRLTPDDAPRTTWPRPPLTRRVPRARAPGSTLARERARRAREITHARRIRPRTVRRVSTCDASAVSQWRRGSARRAHPTRRVCPIKISASIQNHHNTIISSRTCPEITSVRTHIDVSCVQYVVKTPACTVESLLTRRGARPHCIARGARRTRSNRLSRAAPTRVRCFSSFSPSATRVLADAREGGRRGVARSHSGRQRRAFVGDWSRVRRDDGG